jgi:serine/threonine protein kinase
MELITAKPNVIQVFELRETPVPAIIMDYYPLGSMVDAGIVSENKYVTAWGQVLDGLSYLHTKKMAHRDLKPENFLIEMNPLFKVVIADFGMAKVATDSALQTFCGSLKYAAPEVFPGLSSGYGPPVDIWSLGIIVFEWIYGILNPPDPPSPRKKNERVSDRRLYNWLDTWTMLLFDRLEDQEDDKVIQILAHMIEIKATSRWAASRCLAHGFKSGVFKRRVSDGLVACASDPDDPDLPTEEGEDGTRTPTAASSPDSALTPSSVSMSSAGGDPEATIIPGDMWSGGALANSR